MHTDTIQHTPRHNPSHSALHPPTHTGIQHITPNSTFPPAAACMKHFIAYPAAVTGHDRSPIELASRTVKQLYAPPFQAAVRDAEVKSAMEVGGWVGRRVLCFAVGRAMLMMLLQRTPPTIFLPSILPSMMHHHINTVRRTRRSAACRWRPTRST